MQPQVDSSTSSPAVQTVAKRKRPSWPRAFSWILSPLLRLPLIGGVSRTFWLISSIVGFLTFVAGSFWAPTTPLEQAPPARFSSAWWVTSLELNREYQLAGFGDEDIESVAVARTPAGQERVFVGGHNGLLAFSDDRGHTWTRLNYDGLMGGFAVSGQRAPFPDISGNAGAQNTTTKTNSTNGGSAAAKPQAKPTVVTPRGRQNANPAQQKANPARQNANPAQQYPLKQQSAPPPASKPATKPAANTAAALPLLPSLLGVVWASEIPPSVKSSGPSSGADTPVSQATAQASPLQPQPLPRDILAICRADGSLVLALGANRAAVSDDSGLTWKGTFLSAFTGPPSRTISLADFLAGKISGVATQPTRLSRSAETIESILGDTYFSGTLVRFGRPLSRSEDLNPRSVFLSSDGNAWAVADFALGALVKDNSGTGFLYRSDHRDGRWTEAFRTPGIALRDIAFSPDGTTGYVVGQKGGIWRWQADNSLWIPITRGALNPGRSSSDQANRVYWKLPPPWTYLALALSLGWLCIAIFISAVPGADTLAETSDRLSSGGAPAEPHEGVALISVSDRPLGEDDVDRLGFRGIARGVAGFLRNPKTQLPVTLAINGAWGTGKSSLMNLICGELKRAGFRPVWFNAWHHQEDENLLASLLQAVRSEASPPLIRKGGLAFRMRLGWFRFRRYYPRALAMVAVFIGLWAAESWYDHATNLRRFVAGKLGTATAGLSAGKQTDSTAAPSPQSSSSTGGQSPPAQNAPSAPARPDNSAASTSKSSSGWLDSVVNFLGNLHAGSDKVIPEGLPRPFSVLYLLLQIVPATLKKLKAFTANPASLLHSAAPGVSEKEIEAQTSFRMSFAKEFADVTRALGQNHRLVIFVDDLDRCRPVNVAEMMEAINYVTVAGDCAFVLGLETDVVRAALGLSFSAMAQEVKFKNHAPAQPQPAYDDDSPQGKRAKRDTFARNYVEKLINIEMNVPELDIQGKQALFSVEQPAPPKGDPYDRARKIAKVGRLLEPAAMFLLVLALGWGAGRILVRVAEWEAKDYFQDKLEKKPAAPQTAATANAPAAGAEAPNAVQAQANAAPAASQTDIGKTPDVLPGEDPLPAAMRRSPLSWIALAGLFTIVIQLLAREPIPPAKDSNEFSRALTAWSWVAGKGLDTPRATKRFLNRLRFLAMRQHPPAVQLSGLMKLLLTAEQQKRALAEEEARASAGSARQTISEEILVALAALEARSKGTPLNQTAVLPLLDQLTADAVSEISQADLRSAPFLAELGRTATAPVVFTDEKNMRAFFNTLVKEGKLDATAKLWAASATSRINGSLNMYFDLAGEAKFT